MTATLEQRVRAMHPLSPVWAAQPRQAAFLKATEFEVLYGGAAGGGKTDALLVAGLKWVQDYGAQVLFLRRTYPDLSLPGGAIPRSHELYHGLGSWNGSEHKWSFPNGGAVQFGHLEHATAHLSYRGAQIDLLLWDELTQANLEQYLFLRSRVRATRPGVVPAVRAGTNPGDVGHAWVKQRWVDAAPWGEPFEIQAKGAKPVTARFVPARVSDNQRLLERDPGYEDRLAELPDHLRRAYLDGDWDIYEGQYFAEFRRELHVRAPFAIPEDWPRWTSTDYGFADPFCALWFARGQREGERRRIFVYRELYGAGYRDEVQAAAVADKSKGERVLRHIGDPSMFNQRLEQDKPSIASVFQAAGVPLERGTNERVSGWNTVRRALAVDERGEAGLHIFDTCVNLLRTLPAQVHDPLDPEDLADKIRGKKTEDHAVDCLRYGLMSAVNPQPLTAGTMTRGPVAPQPANKAEADLVASRAALDKLQKGGAR